MIAAQTDPGPPQPLLKRLAQRGYSPAERLGLNLLLIVCIAGGEGFLMTRYAPRLDGDHFAIANWIGVAAGSLLFLLRRRAPWTALAATTVLALGELAMRLPGVCLFYVAFCLYGVVARSSQRTGLVLGILSLALGIAAALVGGGTRANPTGSAATGVALVLAVGWLAGENTRASRIWLRYRDEREAQAALAAEAERAERTQRTIADERALIARELHDIVAHSMSVVAVRSGVARMVAGARPEEAIEALAIIETTARESLSEMRRMVSILRGTGGRPADLGPLPGLEDLDGLLPQLAAAGVEVDLQIEGEPRPLAPAADLTVYRIVQEALTNVVRHAGPTRATVRLSFGIDELDIEVTNPTRTASPGRLADSDGGHGLVGMRERAAVFGGSLEAGPVGDGFQVRAMLRLGGPDGGRGRAGDVDTERARAPARA